MVNRTMNIKIIVQITSTENGISFLSDSLRLKIKIKEKIKKKHLRYE